MNDPTLSPATDPGATAAAPDAEAARPDGGRGIRLWFFHPFELYTLLLVGGTVLFLRWRGLRIDWRTVEYTIYPMVPMLPGALVAGIALQALYRLATRRSLGAVGEYLRQIFTLGWITLWLRLWFAAMLMTYSYFWLKVSVPLLNEHLWDPQLWKLDVLLHAGFSPSIFFTQVFKGSFLVPLLDRWYGLWVTTIFYTMAFFTAAPDPLFRKRFMASCVFLWTLGSWIYFALPALGPVYTVPDVWTDLRGQMPRAQGAQIKLWENYQKLLAGRTGILRQFNPTLGVAAMPSLHVAGHWLFALWTRRRARPLYVLFFVATLLTLIGSILTGWHYAVDAYAGLLVAWLCYRLAILGEPAGRQPERSRPEEARPDEATTGASS